MTEKSASQQIDDIITQHGGWKGKTLDQLRAIIKQADPDLVEEVKWKMPSRPEGLPVWSHDGIMCLAETFKADIKLVFTKGAKMKDPKKLFNARLMSKTDRAIQFVEGSKIDSAGIHDLVLEAAELNKQKKEK